jgi:FMN-dependent NADH-azoreductase
MDVNELAEHRLRKIDEEIAEAWFHAEEGPDDKRRYEVPADVHRLMAMRRKTEKLILAGPRGLALVA